MILTEAGLSHPLNNVITQQIIANLAYLPNRHIEFFSESLDLMSFPDKPSRGEMKDWLVRKYGGYKLDVVVAVGPDAVNFLAKYTQTMFLDVPIVICGGAAYQAGNPRLDSRFTGTWTRLEPEKTLEMALRLLPGTRHIVVVGGTSSFDRVALSYTRQALSSFQAKADVTYLTDMEMGGLLEQLHRQPEHSIVLYLSFFQDAAGNEFVNATKALPMIAAASNAPVFGLSDTYLGHGIVGGDVMNFQEQSQVTARIVSQLLDGKKAEDIPIETLPSVFMFDWKELQHWHIPQRSLPPGSVILFREPSLWEKTKWIWATSLVMVLGLSALIFYLLLSRKQLELAKEKQRQLSDMLITAEEKEKTRLAMELHDDFSQRLALLTLGLENAAEAIPDSPRDAEQRLRELQNSASEIGADLHTLSHRLHSSTLESLGLTSGIRTLCREFQEQQGIEVDFIAEGIPQSVAPDPALCLFRIAQEGLRNVKRHSCVTRAVVYLRMSGQKLHLTVRDEGTGFDAKDLNSEKGIGIRSMEKRAQLLGGHFEIHSEPGKGTSLEAWVPLLPASFQARSGS